MTNQSEKRINLDERVSENGFVLGERVRILREKRRITQTEMAAILGTSPSYVCQLENRYSNTVSCKRAYDLSKLLGVSMEYLMSDIEGLKQAKVQSAIYTLLALDEPLLDIVSNWMKEVDSYAQKSGAKAIDNEN